MIDELAEQPAPPVPRDRERIVAAIADPDDVDKASLECEPVGLQYIKMRAGADLSQVRLTGADLRHSIFRNVILRSSDLAGAKLDNASLSDADLTSAELGGITGGAKTELVNAIARNTRLIGASLPGADLTGASLAGANITDANFEGAILERVDLTGAVVSNRTNLRLARLSGARIDLAAAQQLLEASMLSKAQFAQMAIHDPVAQLRVSFAGLFRYLHWYALLVFLLPYLVVVVTHVLDGLLDRVMYGDYCARGCISLWQLATTELAPATPVRIVTAVFLVIYNLLRLALLVKVEHLDRWSQLTGLAVSIETVGARWLAAARWFNALFIVNAALVLAHTISFVDEFLIAK